jgi:hypothetical protein
MVLLAPTFLMIAIGIKLDSRGPIFSEKSVVESRHAFFPGFVTAPRHPTNSGRQSISLGLSGAALALP